MQIHRPETSFEAYVCRGKACKLANPAFPRLPILRVALEVAAGAAFLCCWWGMFCVAVRFIALTPALASDQPAVSTSQFEWPRTYKDGQTTILVYQPEIEKWNGYDFLARFAVSIQAPAQPVPTFGVIWVKANSNVDKEE